MHRSDAWSGLLEVSRLARYFDAMTRRYRIYWAITRILLASSAIGTIAVILDEATLSPSERAIVPAIILVVLAIDLVLDFGKTAALLDTVRKDLSQLEQEYRILWEKGTGFEGASELLSRAIAVSNRVDLSTNNRLNQKCTEASYKVEAERYAA